MSQILCCVSTGLVSFNCGGGKYLFENAVFVVAKINYAYQNRGC